MLNTSGLSLEQAPPISIPFRFFLTAPLFGIAAGLVLLIAGEGALVSRWSPTTLALTHLLTLGLLGMVMCGAMLQMLPVIAGSPVPAVVPVGALSHFLIGTGLVALQGGFLGAGVAWMGSAVVLLGAGFLLLIGAVAVALWRVQAPSTTIVGMRLALLALLLTVSLGTLLAGGYAGLLRLPGAASLTNTHLTWGLAGWIGLLLVSVSFQVVPMFQVTPDYPAWFRRWAPVLVFTAMVAWTLLRHWGGEAGLPAVLAPALVALVGLVFVGYAVVTLGLQRRRKRRLSDVTLWFWRLAMASLLLAVLLLIGGIVWPGFAASPRYPLAVGVVLLLGVALSAVNGMLYKIVPFLSWFHLQNRQVKSMCLSVPVPHMKEFVTDRAARWQFRVAALAYGMVLAAVPWPGMATRFAGALFLLSNLLLLVNLVAAVIRYRATAHALADCASESNTP